MLKPVLHFTPSFTRIEKAPSSVELLKITDKLKQMDGFRHQVSEIFPYGFACSSQRGESATFVRKEIVQRFGHPQFKLNLKKKINEVMNEPENPAIADSPWDTFHVVDSNNFKNIHVFMFRSNSHATELFLTLHGTQL